MHCIVLHHTGHLFAAETTSYVRLSHANICADWQHLADLPNFGHWVCEQGLLVPLEDADNHDCMQLHICLCHQQPLVKHWLACMLAKARDRLISAAKLLSCGSACRCGAG